MNPKVVFFGEADYGKSTIIGYLYSHAYKIDMNRVESRMRSQLGNKYKNDILYSSLINPDIWSSQTKQVTETRPLADFDVDELGTRVIKDTDDETIIQTTTVAGDKVQIVTQTHYKSIVQRLNTTTHHLKNFRMEYNGKNIRFMLVDTPGHTHFLRERELGISMSDIGVFCISMNEILRDDFEEMLFAFEDIWSQYNYNKKLIYALTKFDLCDYSEDDYKLACERIKRYCKRVNTSYDEDVFGMSLSFSIEEDDAAAIVPVAVEFSDRTGVNIVDYSDKCPWYKGPTLVSAIIERMDELKSVIEQNSHDGLLFSIDKMISNTKSKAGKVWRIHVLNGTVSVGDRIVLTSCSVSGMNKNELYNVTGVVKSIHREVDVIEGENLDTSASTGDIVTISLKNCAVDRKTINKGDISTTKLSIGFRADEKLEKRDEFDIDLRLSSSAFERVREGQNIVLLWFGRRVTAKVVGISENDYRIHVSVFHEKALDFPTDRAFLRVDDFRNIKFFIESEGKLWYYTGTVCM